MGKKKSPKYTSKFQLTPPWALPLTRPGRDVFFPSPWAGSCPQPGKAEGGAEIWEEAAALPSLVPPPPHALPSVSHTAAQLSLPQLLSPSSFCLQALWTLTFLLQIPSKRGGGGVWPAEALRGWTSTALNCRRMCLLEAKGKILSENSGSKDSAFLLTFLNSQHCHNSLANFRRSLFKMWE